MGKYDLCMKEYLQNKQHFADLFNGCCFHGKQVIKAEELQEASESYVENGDSGSIDTKSQSFRDIKMQLGSGMVLQVSVETVEEEGSFGKISDYLCRTIIRNP